MAIRKRAWTTPGGAAREAWVADYTDGSGKRRLKTFTTQGAAKAWLATAAYEVQQGIHTPASTSGTVGDAFAAWIEHCRAEGLERSTIEQRCYHLNLHVVPFIGDVRLAELTAPRVHQFLDALRANGRSLAMRRKVLTNLKTAIAFAQGRGLVAQNVAAGVKLKASERTASTGPLRAGVDFPTKTELKALIDHAPARWRPLIITAVLTGMRISELRGLSWRDVDLARGIIRVRQRADAWRTIGSPKSRAGKRDIPLAPLVVNTLREWKLRCPKGELELVFPNSVGRPVTVPNLRDRVLGPLLAAAGISPAYRPKYGWHSLRHAAASLFIEQLGWSPKRLQAVMGHASITMTYDHYGHLFEDAAADSAAMGKLENALRAIG
jgi:integrase